MADANSGVQEVGGAVGHVYNPADLKVGDLPEIRPDGSVNNPFLISPEQARALDAQRLGAEVQPNVTTTAIDLAKSLGATELAPAPAQPAAPAAAPAPAQPAAPAAAPAAPAAEDKVVTVGGVAKKESEWLTEMDDAYGVDTSQLPAEQRGKMLDGYINTAHKSAWQKANTQKAEVNAAQRRDLDRRADAVALKERELNFKAEQLALEKQQLTVLAGQKMSKQEIYGDDGMVDPDRLTKYSDIQRAQSRLAQIDSQLGQIQQDQQRVVIDRRLAEVEVLMADHPEFQMSEPLPSVIQKFEGGQREHVDAQKLLDIYDMMDYAHTRGIPLATAYERMSARGMLAVKATVPSLPAVQQPAHPQQQIVAAINQRQATTPLVASPEGSQPSRPVLVPRKTLGDQVRDASSRAGGGRGNTALEQLGY